MIFLALVLANVMYKQTVFGLSSATLSRCNPHAVVFPARLDVTAVTNRFGSLIKANCLSKHKSLRLILFC